MEQSTLTDPLVWMSLGLAAMSAAVVIWYLVFRPALTRVTKVALLFGIGLLPIGSAMTSNYVGFEATKGRPFCGSCHVMKPYTHDSENPMSTSLAARHARNNLFGGENCYACHEEYGMFSTIRTKIGGMRHVYEYVFHYRNMSLEEAKEKIHIRRPFQNSTCMQCHSTENPGWNAIKDHASVVDRVRTGAVGCASDGCHGPAHPFSKPPVPPKKEEVKP